ncbi:MAG: hypothetical protein JSS75_07390 [Bacteroidetes bacterium]|nr:hypothetical protein [Bacteroidota bacterium]
MNTSIILNEIGRDEITNHALDAANKLHEIETKLMKGVGVLQIHSALAEIREDLQAICHELNTSTPLPDWANDRMTQEFIDRCIQS